MATARQLPRRAKILVALLLAVAFALGVAKGGISVRTSNLSADGAAVERDPGRVRGEDHYLTENEQR
jgi:hypothetical protein